jgi:hypothetical protein
MKVIRVAGFANGDPCPLDGQWIESFDFEAFGGQGFGSFTRDKRKAMQFADVGEAFAFWRTRSRRRPLRPDGKPNRPLTSTHVVIEDL